MLQENSGPETKIHCQLLSMRGDSLKVQWDCSPCTAEGIRAAGGNNAAKVGGDRTSLVDRPAPMMSPIDLPCCIQKKDAYLHSPRPISDAPVFGTPGTTVPQAVGCTPLYSVVHPTDIHSVPFSSYSALFLSGGWTEMGLRLDAHSPYDDSQQTPLCTNFVLQSTLRHGLHLTPVILHGS